MGSVEVFSRRLIKILALLVVGVPLALCLIVFVRIQSGMPLENLSWVDRTVFLAFVKDDPENNNLNAIQDRMLARMLCREPDCRAESERIFVAVYGDVDPALLRDPNYMMALPPPTAGSPDQQAVIVEYKRRIYQGSN